MKVVYDVTIAYAKYKSNEWVFQQPPSFGQTLMVRNLSKEFKFFVHIERYTMKELPSGDKELAKWLEDRWVEKGERLEVLRQKLEKGLPWEPF